MGVVPVKTTCPFRHVAVFPPWLMYPCWQLSVRVVPCTTGSAGFVTTLLHVESTVSQSGVDKITVSFEVKSLKMIKKLPIRSSRTQGSCLCHTKRNGSSLYLIETGLLHEFFSSLLGEENLPYKPMIAISGILKP